jgi:hypothetical protein
MNVIAAQKDEFEKLLEDLSSDRVVSGILFVALVDAYVTRLDTNCSDISRPPQSAARANKWRIKHGTNVDSELRTLLRAT